MNNCEYALSRRSLLTVGVAGGMATLMRQEAKPEGIASTNQEEEAMRAKVEELHKEKLKKDTTIINIQCRGTIRPKEFNTRPTWILVELRYQEGKIGGVGYIKHQDAANNNLGKNTRVITLATNASANVTAITSESCQFVAECTIALKADKHQPGGYHTSFGQSTCALSNGRTFKYDTWWSTTPSPTKDPDEIVILAAGQDFTLSQKGVKLVQENW